MSNFIDARVIQKTGSESEWLANDLILYKGELALVTQGDRVINIKVGNGTKKFSELPYIYNGGFTDSVTPTTQGSTLVDGMYIANGAGTYTNMGGLVVKDGYFTIISKIGNAYKIASEVKMPEYDDTELRGLVNQKLNISSIDSLIYLPSTLLNFTLRNGGVSPDNGNTNNSTNWISTNFIDVLPNTTYSISGYSLDNQSTNARLMFYNNEVYVSYIPSISDVFTFTTPSGVNKLKINVVAGLDVGIDVPNSPYQQSFKILKGNSTEGFLVAEKIKGNIATEQIEDIEESVLQIPLLDSKIDEINSIESATIIYGNENITPIDTGRVNTRLSIVGKPLSNDESNSILKKITLSFNEVGNITIAFYSRNGLVFTKQKQFNTSISSVGLNTINFPSNFEVSNSWYLGFIGTDGQAVVSGVNNAPELSSFYLASNYNVDTITVTDSAWLFPYKLEAETNLNIKGKFNQIDNKLNNVISDKKAVSYALVDGISPAVNGSGWYKCCPVVRDTDEQGRTLGCTGMSWDSKRDLFIVSEFGGNYSARLLIFKPSELVDRDLSNPKISPYYKSFDIFQYIRGIQGCYWDWVDDTYNIIGASENGGRQTIVKLNPNNGNLIDLIDCGWMTDSNLEPGMFDLDLNGNILFKPNNSSLLYFLDRETLRPVSAKTAIYHEGLAVNRYNGDIWVASQNDDKINKYDKDFNLIYSKTYMTFPNEVGGANVEGMAILKDGSLVMSADTYLHGGTPYGNALFFFDFDNTANKKLYFDTRKEFKEDKGVVSEVLSSLNNISNIITNAENVKYRSNDNFTTLIRSDFSNNFTASKNVQIKY